MSGADGAILVSGGAGFVGSAVVRRLVASGHRVVNLDKLTYAGDLRSLRSIEDHPRYRFVRADICDGPTVRRVLGEENVSRIVHLAAESHVDRSIDGPMAFVQTNVVGTATLLEAALDHWREMPAAAREGFRFHHVSTDEVFGALPLDAGRFTESSPYRPSSPYSASKAASDHLVRAWRETYGLPVVISNCSNNYGPFCFPEKLIPLLIVNAIEEKPLPLYGDGRNVRDWIHVDDHARAVETVLLRGRTGRSYAVGGGSERSNLQVAEAICELMDRKRPRRGGASHRELVALVADRPGHDRRYAVDSTRLRSELGWSPEESFESGLAGTVEWYLGNEWWWRPLRERGPRRQGAGR